MSVSQIKSDPTVFTSSPALEFSSKVTSPDNIIAYGMSPVAALVAGGASLLGAPMPVAAALGAGVTALPRLFNTLTMGGDALRPAVFVEAEEMSVLIQMGQPIYTLRPALEAVQHMKSGSENVKKLKGLLQNMLFFEEHFDYTGLTNGRLLELCKDSVKKLAVGQSIALPCTVAKIAPNIQRMEMFGGHAMVAVIERTSKGFSVTIHNGGEGSGKHYHKENARGLVQTAYQIDEIGIPEVLTFIDGIGKLHALRPKNTTDILYKELLPNLKGKPAPASNDPRVWSKGQTGNSCSGFSSRCMIKSVLSKQEFREFEAHFLSLMVKELTQGIESHRVWEQTPHHHWILRMLKLKLHAPDLQPYLDKETRALLKKTDDIPPTLSGRVVGKLQVVPLGNFSRNILVFAGLNPRLSRQTISLKKRFMIISDDRGQQKYKDVSNRKIEKLFKKINCLYHRLDRSAFTTVQAQELDAAFADLEKRKNKAVKDLDAGMEPFFVAIWRFEEATIPHYKKHPTNPFVAPLFKAIDLLKQNKIRDAKEHLSKLYEEINSYSGKLNAAQIGELNFVREDFTALYRTHYPETPEALECFAVIDVLSNKIRKKRESAKIDTFSRSSLDGVFKIFEEKLSHVLNGSIWKEELAGINKRHAQKIKAQYAGKAEIPFWSLEFL
jgi:hypothetical protein